MSTLISNATIKIRRDTTSNWSTNNPTPLQGEWCLETDTGNIKIGDGSTAWTSLPYYGQNTALPYKYDISSSGTTVTLPLLTGGIQKRTYKWTGGDGTYKLQFSVPDNTGTYSTSEYEGEGEGVITFEATNTDSGLAWEVTKYEDSGSNSNGNWKKEIDGELKQYGSYTNTNGTASYTVSFPLTFNSVNGCLATPRNSTVNSDTYAFLGASGLTTSQAIIFVRGAAWNTEDNYVAWQAIGTWK